MPAYIDYTEDIMESYLPESGVKELRGTLSIPDQIGDPYEGAYEVTPDDEFHLLPTAGAYLEDDILVYPIPYAEVSNTFGGYTVTIGG